MTVMYYENDDKSDIVSFSKWRANNIIQSVIEVYSQIKSNIDYSSFRLVDFNHSDENSYSDIKECNYELFYIDPISNVEILLFEIQGDQTIFNLGNIPFSIESFFKPGGQSIMIKVDCQGFIVNTFFSSIFPCTDKGFIDVTINNDIKNNISIIGCHRNSPKYIDGYPFIIENYQMSIQDVMLVFNLEQASQSNHELAQLIPEVSIVSAYDFNSIDFNNRLSIAQMMIS